jgi:hypothetical protein
METTARLSMVLLAMQIAGLVAFLVMADCAAAGFHGAHLRSRSSTSKYHAGPLSAPCRWRC